MRSLVLCCGAEYLGQLLLVRVDRAGDERRLGPDRDAQRVERVIQEPIGVDFVTLPSSEVGEY